MRTIVNLIVAGILLMAIPAKAQDFKKTESFKVYGNCDMCKNNIETALKKKDGIYSKRWDKNLKVLTVTFDSTKISLKQIHEKVAEVGYDTDLSKASDAAYNKLHSCCQYDRPKN